MTSTKRPFGLAKARSVGQGHNSMGTTRYRVGASAPSAIALGDPVARGTQATVQPATAVGDYPFGVAAGFSYVDSNTKRPVWTGLLQAGTSSADGNIWIDVYDGDQHTFLVQADASVSYGDVGFNFALSAVGTPDANGKSNAVLRVASRTSGLNAGYRVIGFAGQADNLVGDAFTIVEVKIQANEATRVSVL